MTAEDDELEILWGQVATAKFGCGLESRAKALLHESIGALARMARIRE